MKKLSFAIALLGAIVVLAGMDYWLNAYRPGSEPVTVHTPDQAPNLTQALLEKNPGTLNFQIIRRNRTTQFFEKIDLSSTPNLRVYRNHLSTPDARPLIVYEVQGPKGEGGVTYLALKLRLTEQIDATAFVNENNTFGQSSFYFNDLNSPHTSFLAVLSGDTVFGFQFNKEDPADFELVKTLIQSLN